MTRVTRRTFFVLKTHFDMQRYLTIKYFMLHFYLLLNKYHTQSTFKTYLITKRSKDQNQQPFVCNVGVKLSLEIRKLLQESLLNAK